jgi:hypothetical protein
LCPICEPIPYSSLNQNVPIDGVFTVGNGIRVLQPPAHTLCRCTAGLVIADT